MMSKLGLGMYPTNSNVGGMVHAYVDQKLMPTNLIVRQNQPLKVKKSAQKAQMTKQTPSPW
jgi:hypothetical protein